MCGVTLSTAFRLTSCVTCVACNHTLEFPIESRTHLPTTFVETCTCDDMLLYCRGQHPVRCTQEAEAAMRVMREQAGATEKELQAQLHAAESSIAGISKTKESLEDALGIASTSLTKMKEVLRKQVSGMKEDAARTGANENALRQRAESLETDASSLKKEAIESKQKLQDERQSKEKLEETISNTRKRHSENVELSAAKLAQSSDKKLQLQQKLRLSNEAIKKSEQKIHALESTVNKSMEDATATEVYNLREQNNLMRKSAKMNEANVELRNQLEQNPGIRNQGDGARKVEELELQIKSIQRDLDSALNQNKRKRVVEASSNEALDEQKCNELESVIKSLQKALQEKRDPYNKIRDEIVHVYCSKLEYWKYQYRAVAGAYTKCQESEKSYARMKEQWANKQQSGNDQQTATVLLLQSDCEVLERKLRSSKQETLTYMESLQKIQYIVAAYNYDTFINGVEDRTAVQVEAGICRIPAYTPPILSSPSSLIINENRAVTKELKRRNKTDKALKNHNPKV